MAPPVLTPNSPVAGSISWTAFHIAYRGKSYSIPAGNTALKYTWWPYNGGLGGALQTSNVLPSLLVDDCLLFLNKSGIGATVPTAQAIDGSLIVSESIYAGAIQAGSLTTDRLAAGAITADKIAAGAITAGLLAADAITGKTITGGSIVGSTITGSFMSTGTTGPRITLNKYDGITNDSSYAYFYTGGAGEKTPSLLGAVEGSWSGGATTNESLIMSSGSYAYDPGGGTNTTRVAKMTLQSASSDATSTGATLDNVAQLLAVSKVTGAKSLVQLENDGGYTQWVNPSGVLTAQSWIGDRSSEIAGWDSTRTNYYRFKADAVSSVPGGSAEIAAIQSSVYKARVSVHANGLVGLDSSDGLTFMNINANDDNGNLWKSGANTGIVQIQFTANKCYIATNVGGGVSVTDNGTGYKPILASAFTVGSARDTKRDIENLGGMLDKVLAMRPVAYRPVRGTQTRQRSGEDTPHDRWHYGRRLSLVAEELREVLPEAVSVDERGQPDGVSVGDLVSALVGAVQELSARVDGLSRE